ncbi:MAG: hypothetical protein LAP21_15225 [Acidobacteriia bacterium]|nr:hypothetical protein [Terriglobia bacterium]
MGFVAAQFTLPTVTNNSGGLEVLPTPGRCPLVRRRGAQYAKPRPAQVINIRPAAPPARLVLLPAQGRSSNPTLNGFWDSLKQGITGAVKGFAVGGPIGAAAGAAGGAITGSVGTGKGKAAPQAAAQSPSALGPLAGISTGVLVSSVLGFSALILVLARGGGR